MLALLLFLDAIGSPIVSLSPRVEVLLAGREIRLADVADLGGLDPAAAAALGSRVIAVLPDGRERVELSRQALKRLARRSVPGLALGDGGVAPIVFRLLEPTPKPAAPACAELGRPLRAGSLLSVHDIRPAVCRDDGPLADIRFDRLNGVVRANGDLAAGAYLGRISITPAPIVDKGDRLTLVASAGPVRVMREVVAMQAGRAGGRLFVRDLEGQMTSVPLAAAGGAE